MNEFNFRVAPRASGNLGPNSGDTATLVINSFKTKYINGNAGGRTNVAFDDPLSSQVPSWLQISHVWSDAEEAYKVTFKALESNTGAARSFTATFTQWESGKQISYTITQDENFTYTYFLDILNVSATMGANIGDTTNIFVQSYMLRNDGEKIAKQPSVGATPTFASKVTIKTAPEGGEHWYKLTLEATAANLDSSERSGTLLVTCGDQRKEVTVYQQAAAQYITLILNWPYNTNTGAFFASGESPQSGSTGISYFSMVILNDKTTHTYESNVGLLVNKGNGQTVDVLPGNAIHCYRFINSAWSAVGSFILPNSNKTINL